MADPVKIGKYDVLERIGRGGMGFVYRAVDPLLKREVALKTMLKDLSGDEDLRSRFMREAQSAGGLRHPNVVTIYDLGEDDQHCPYIAMEFLTGTDLEHIIKNKVELPLLKKLDIIVQTCQGLSYAHSKGIIHRDIKPANIRLLDNGEVKIMDFGIAKIAASHFTRTGMIMGTPHYMAPEQIRGETVDGRADIFSLGVVLFELLVFRKPFAGDNPTAVLFKIIHSEPDALTDAKFTPPDGLEEITQRALAKKPEDRYQSCDEMLADLMALFDRLKDTEKIEPTFIIEKPYAALAISKTPTPRKVTPIPKPVVPTPAGGTKKIEPMAPATKIPTPAPVSERSITSPAAVAPPKTSAPAASDSKKWILLVFSVVISFAVIAALLFFLVRKISLSELRFPRLNPKSNSAPSPPPKKQQAPVERKKTVEPPQQQPVEQPPQAQPAEQFPQAQPAPTEPAPAPLPTGFVALNIQPWAEVKAVKDNNGNYAPIVCSVTPCRIELPAGSYEISLYNAQFQNTIIRVDVKSKETTLVNQRMEGFDYAKAVESLDL